MQIPYWLLKFLPLFDYLCPRCRKEVPKNSHECPSCGEKYPLPLRVPPKVMKDPKALEDYVHQHVFPKVSASQREYLTQFFTVLFANGVEEGNFSAWTGTAVDPGNTLEVVAAALHHGSFGIHTKDNSDIPDSEATAIAYKNFTAGLTIFEREYVRFLNVPALVNAYIRVMDLRVAGTQRFAAGLMKEAGGDVKWFLNYLDAGAQHNAFSAAASIDTSLFYCVEMKAKTDAAAGEARLFINGVEVITLTGLNTGAVGMSRTEVGSGQVDSVPPAANIWDNSVSYIEMYFDCVVVADIGPIGPEVEVVEAKFRGWKDWWWQPLMTV